MMFVVEVADVFNSLIRDPSSLGGQQAKLRYDILFDLDVWLFLTVLFANFATALAEARGKLRPTRSAELAATQFLSAWTKRRHRRSFFHGVLAKATKSSLKPDSSSLVTARLLKASPPSTSRQ